MSDMSLRAKRSNLKLLTSIQSGLLCRGFAPPCNCVIILDEEKIKKVLKIKDVIKIVEDGFRKKRLGLVSLPPKMGPNLYAPGAFAESMPVAVFETQDSTKMNRRKKLQVFGIKWQSAFKSNLKKGIPYLNNLIILNEPKCGLPIAVLKGNWITAIRTAAVSAVCAKYLAPRKKELNIGIFGLGLQAFMHVLAFKSIFKKVQFILYEHNKNSLKDFLKKFPKEKIIVLKNIHKIVRSSDIVLSATTFPLKISPYIFKNDLRDDVLILPLEYGTRIDPNIYKCLDEIYTDDINQYELKSKLKHYFPATRPEIKIEIGDLIRKKYKRGKMPRKILVFNLGIALFDILVALQVLKKLKIEKGVKID